MIINAKIIDYLWREAQNSKEQNDYELIICLEYNADSSFPSLKLHC